MNLKHPRRSFVVRKARLRDADRIHDVLKQAFKGLEGRRYPTQAIETAIVDVEEIKRRMRSEGHVLLAELDNEIIGTVSGLEEHQSMHVCSLAVHPDYQNCGVARQLMECLETIARRRGCSKLFLCTAWAMKEAIWLYEKLGYVREGHLRKHFYGEDFMVFSKFIREADSRI